MRRPSPSLVLALIALALSAGVAVAASGSGQKKVVTRVIRKLAPTLSVKKAKTVTRADNAGTADSAASAASADSVGGRSAADLVAAGKIVHFSFTLTFGADRPIITAGSLSLTAQCRQNITDNGGGANQDVSRIVIATTQDGAVFEGDDSKRGGPLPTDFLNTTTLETDRVFTEDSTATGTTNFDAENDSGGAATAPDGSSLALSQDGVGLGENVLGANCLFQGTAVVEN